MTVELTDADGFAPEANLHDLVVLAISRREIESCAWPSALERLLRISDNATAAQAMQGRLLFMVQGYDQDRRMLGEIPQVCDYMRQLTAAWPFWVTFVLPDAEVISPLLGTLVGLSRATGRENGAWVDLNRSEQVISDLVAAHRRISAGLGLPRSAQIEATFVGLCRNLGWLPG